MKNLSKNLRLEEKNQEIFEIEWKLWKFLCKNERKFCKILLWKIWKKWKHCFKLWKNNGEIIISKVKNSDKQTYQTIYRLMRDWNFSVWIFCGETLDNIYCRADSILKNQKKNHQYFLPASREPYSTVHLNRIFFHFLDVCMVYGRKNWISESWFFFHFYSDIYEELSYGLKSVNEKWEVRVTPPSSHIFGKEWFFDRLRTDPSSLFIKVFVKKSWEAKKLVTEHRE